MLPITSDGDQPTSEVIFTIKQAVRRAQYFTKDLRWGGPFSPVSRERLAIPIRNGLWFMELVPYPTTEDDAQCELFAIWWMARSINKWIDGHLVENDEETKWSLAAFLSRALPWADWSKLE